MVECCNCRGSVVDNGILEGTETTNKNLYKTLTQIFQDKLAHNKIDGSKTAIQYGDYQTLTFAQVESFSSAIALGVRDRIGYDVKLEKFNSKPDPLVAICMSPSEKLVPLMLGVLKTGSAFLPIDPEYPEELILLIITTFKPLALIADENGPITNNFDCERFQETCILLTVEDLWLEMELPSSMALRDILDTNANENLSLFPLHENDKKKNEFTTSTNEKTAVIIQTQGFDRDPLGVRISHRNLVNRVSWEWKCFQVKSNDVYTLTFPVGSFDNISQIFRAILKGCTLNIFKRTDVSKMTNFIELLSARQVTIVSLYSHQVHHFLAAADTLGRDYVCKSLHNLRLLFCQGGCLTKADAAWIFAVFKNKELTVANCNSPVETSGAVVYETFKSVKEFESFLLRGKLGFSKVVDNCKIYILGRGGDIVDEGSQGEVCAGGFCVALGHVHESLVQKSTQIFKPNLQHETNKTKFDTIYHSGEYGRIATASDGKVRRLFVEGRCDTIKKVKGHWVDIGDVKRFIESMDFVQEVFILIFHEEKFDQEVIAFIVLKKGWIIEKVPVGDELLGILSKKLPEFILPDEIKILDTIPETPTGKRFPQQLLITYEESREPDFSLLDSDTNPQDEAHYLAKKELFSALYKFASISVESACSNVDLSFFEIGGTSLNALSVVLYLHSAGYAISLMEFLECDTIHDIVNDMVFRNRQRVPTRTITQSFYTVDIRTYYIIEPLQSKHRKSAIGILSRCYAEKGPLQKYNMVTYRQYHNFFTDNWKIYEDSGTSFVVYSKNSKKIVAVALNIDFFTITDTSKAEGALFHLIEFVHEIKGTILHTIPKKKGECFENQWVGTDNALTPEENIKICVQIQIEIMRLAKMQFSCVFSASFSPMTTKICHDILGYKVLDYFPVNEFKELDESRPFKLAPSVVMILALLFTIREPPSPISSVSSMTVVSKRKSLKKSK